jgi:hypothetical protein
MRVIDKSPYQSADGKITFWNRMQGFFAYGSSWHREMEAQQEIVGQMARVLDNRFVLLRNVVLPGTDVPIPLILAGPTGIWVMLVSGARGVYRAKGDSWLTMDGGRFKAAKPNMLNRVQLMVRALDTHLRKDAVPIPEIRPALLFINPGMHVDSVHPSARVVLSDAMDRFIASLVQDTGAVRTDVVQKVVQSLTPGEELREAEAGQAAHYTQNEDDFFAFQDDAGSGQASGQTGSSGGEGVGSVIDRLNISSRQWIVLGVLFGLWILVLLVFAFIIMFLL